MTDVAIPFEAFARPDRAVVARAWLKRNPLLALNWRGADGETLLHWGAMSDLGLLLDLVGAGLDSNAHDLSGRTPLDWLCDRLWMACVAHEAGLDDQGQWRLRTQTEELTPALWAQGGRSGGSPDALHPGLVWSQAGAWPLVEMLRAEDGLGAWNRVGPHGQTVMHGWVVAPERPEKHRVLERAVAAGFSVDALDDEGRTPLWYAVDAWVAQPHQADKWRAAIASLLKAGADPSRASRAGVSPEMLPLHHKSPEDLQEAIATLFQILD